MAVTDFFVGEITTELLKNLLLIVKKSTLCRSSAENLIDSINGLLPIIQEIKQTGVELPQIRQTQLDDFSKLLRDGYELAGKVVHSGRWNMYRCHLLIRL
uniref:Nbs-lrr resistance protein n=1 Tax=Solanum tuberosum TaxID=4113 RepID=M1ADV0_SOLTU